MPHDDRPHDDGSPGGEVHAWRVHDTGLVAAPGPFRRLPGAVRHHAGRGRQWPDQVTLRVSDGHLHAEEIGSWALGVVSVRLVGDGPPISFVVQVPEGSHLLAAPADAGTRALLAALGV